MKIIPVYRESRPFRELLGPFQDPSEILPGPFWDLCRTLQKPIWEGLKRGFRECLWRDNIERVLQGSLRDWLILEGFESDPGRVIVYKILKRFWKIPGESWKFKKGLGRILEGYRKCQGMAWEAFFILLISWGIRIWVLAFRKLKIPIEIKFVLPPQFSFFSQFPGKFNCKIKSVNDVEFY